MQKLNGNWRALFVRSQQADLANGFVQRVTNRLIHRLEPVKVGRCGVLELTACLAVGTCSVLLKVTLHRGERSQRGLVLRSQVDQVERQQASEILWRGFITHEIGGRLAAASIALLLIVPYKDARPEEPSVNGLNYAPDALCALRSPRTAATIFSTGVIWSHSSRSGPPSRYVRHSMRKPALFKRVACSCVALAPSMSRMTPDIARYPRFRVLTVMMSSRPERGGSKTALWTALRRAGKESIRQRSGCRRARMLWGDEHPNGTPEDSSAASGFYGNWLPLVARPDAEVGRPSVRPLRPHRRPAQRLVCDRARQFGLATHLIDSFDHCADVIGGRLVVVTSHVSGWNESKRYAECG